ncbi:MAG: hydantoinase/oxoprolinase family protein [Novosphingobium sp.]|nr:hydantoinase/oxoprolinase family protein [Novosphingobium sp.]
MLQAKGQTQEGDYAIGVDVGGTHTDLIMSTPDELIRSKAFTTHGNYSEGILRAIGLAAEQIGKSTEEVLSSCRAFVNGSTIVTNAITELRGAKTGVLITRGFKDTFRLAGGARTREYDDQLQVPPPEVVERDCIVEVSERVDSSGSVIVAPDVEELRNGIRLLKANGVEAVAVCFLWSFQNPVNELQAEAILKEEFSEAFVTLSHATHPVIGEFPRFMTAVFNCLSHRATTRYIEGLKSELGRSGFAGTMTFFQGIGGSIGIDAVEEKPITLMQSGPAGGVMGARQIAEKLGIRNVLVGDMGGTSFDTAVLADLTPTVAREAAFGVYRTGINILDIVSVGAGGGSIAWLDGRGVPQVGPHSAGSEPGPACYGRGGTRPTVTDANVILGLIDPDNYLKGAHKLDVAAAREAVDAGVGTALGWSTERAAAAIYDLAVIEMANALRMVSVERGYHPRDFTFFSYGGGLGLFAVEICRRLGCPNIIVPDNCSAFSAYGVLTADYVRQYNRTVNWALDDPSQAEQVNAALDEMLAQARADAESENIDAGALEIERRGDFRFLGQVHEVSQQIPEGTLTAKDAAEMAASFPAVYEANYGEGTAWDGSPVVLVNIAIKAIFRREKPVSREQEPLTDAPAPAPVSIRRIFQPFLREEAEVPVYAEKDLPPGIRLDGPCIVDVGDTTLYVPSGAVCARDRFFNFSLTLNG